jgi:hypothetical protein
MNRMRYNIWLMNTILGLESISQLVCIQFLILEPEKTNKVENFAHFEFFFFSTGRKYLLRLKSRFSWSTAHALSNDVKKKGKKKFYLKFILSFFSFSIFCYTCDISDVVPQKVLNVRKKKMITFLLFCHAWGI